MEKQWNQIDTYNSICLSEYNGTWSIMLGNRGDQKTYEKWTCPVVWRNGEKRLLEKNGENVLVPLQVPLGKGKAQAVKSLELLLHQLKAA